jgi:hypothetical protein
LKLQYKETLSNFAVKFHLRLYTKVRRAVLKELAVSPDTMQFVGDLVGQCMLNRSNPC